MINNDDILNKTGMHVATDRNRRMDSLIKQKHVHAFIVKAFRNPKDLIKRSKRLFSQDFL